MDNNTLRILLEDRIKVLKERKDHYLREVESCTARIEELEDFQTSIDDLSKKMAKKNIQENIKKNTFKDILTEEADIKRINTFLEFKEKCGSETTYAVCKKKMPKLEPRLYRKGRLWANWSAFLEDYNKWLRRESPWDKILVD